MEKLLSAAVASGEKARSFDFARVNLFHRRKLPASLRSG
jgi:hypothetical protein